MGKKDQINSSFSKLSFGFALLDRNFIVKSINSRFACILGINVDQLRGQNLTAFLPKLKDFRIDHSYEYYKVVRNGGQTLLLDVIKEDTGSQSEFLVFCRDNTCYEQLSGRYDHVSEELSVLNKMFNVLYDGVFISDGLGVTVYVNDSFLALSGLKREELIGHTVFELMEKNIVPNSCCAKVLRTRQPESVINNYYAGKSCLVSGTPVFEGDKLIRVVSIVRDVTELNCLRDNLANATSLSLSYKHQLKEIEVKNQSKELVNIRSKAMKNILETAIKVAAVDSPLLLLGETGVGKDFLAKFIHSIGSQNSDGCFATVNCNAIPETLLESELFGYEPGAFSGANKHGKAGLFELANNGTLFLDEIGDIPLSLQVKLLNALQDKKFYRVGGTKTVSLQARIIAATNADLDKLIRTGRFRSDLYYRLSVIVIEIPPLRFRRDDIIPLAIDFLNQYNQHYSKQRYFSPETVNFLLNYEWPGNIRELKNVVERLVIMSDHDHIEPRHFEKKMITSMQYTDLGDSLSLPPNIETRTLKQIVSSYEAAVIEEAIKKHRTLKAAAESLSIDQSTLIRKRQRSRDISEQRS